MRFLYRKKQFWKASLGHTKRKLVKMWIIINNLMQTSFRLLSSWIWNEYLKGWIYGYIQRASCLLLLTVFLIYQFLGQCLYWLVLYFVFLRKNTLRTRQEKQNKRKHPVFGSHEYWCPIAFWRVPQNLYVTCSPEKIIFKIRTLDVRNNTDTLEKNTFLFGSISAALELKHSNWDVTVWFIYRALTT